MSAAHGPEREDLVLHERAEARLESVAGTEISVGIARYAAQEHTSYSVVISARWGPGPNVRRCVNQASCEFELDPADFEALHGLLGTAITRARALGILVAEPS